MEIVKLKSITTIFPSQRSDTRKDHNITTACDSLSLQASSRQFTSPIEQFPKYSLGTRFVPSLWQEHKLLRFPILKR